MKEKAMPNLIESVFIVEPFNVGWIIENLMRDIAHEMETLGIRVRIGPQEQFKNEMVAIHTRGYYFKAIPNCTLNSVFMTHIDDVFKEKEMLIVANEADSLVCLSEHSAEIMRGLGVGSKKVIGNSLPHRGGVVRRPRIGIFSERYSDGRKNEEWLIDFYKKTPLEHRTKFIFCFIGYGWESLGVRLAELGACFEIYRYDRSMPGEYESQKDLVATLDKLMYMGFDGGSMSIYDGMHANVDLIFPDNCYHRDFDEGVTLFSNKNEFFEVLDKIADGVASKEEAMHSRSVKAYTQNLLKHWNSLLFPEIIESTPKSTDVDSNVFYGQIKQFRHNYRTPRMRDAVTSLYRFIKRF
jgi:hypothetical protein